MSEEIPPDNDGFNLGDDNFDNFEGKKNTLGAMWREKPMFKVGVVVGAAVLIFGTIFLFGGSGEQKPDLSIVPQGAEITAPPGTEEASPAYIDAVKEQNDARTEQAQREGGSSLPTPIEPPVGVVAVPEDETPDEDPLQRWRKLQEERLQRELQRSQNLAPEALPQEEANRQQAIDQLSQTMAQQMQAILETRNQVKVNQMDITDPDYLEQLKQADEKEAAAQAAATTATDNANIEEIIYPAGEIAYAQLITEANSDAPGPVLAQIAGGILNGARVLGDFQVHEDKLLTLNFDTIVIDGISYDVQAVAIDPSTTLPAMATDVDHHYLKRVVLPMAASFVEGLSQAVSDSGQTTVVVDGGAAVSDSKDKDNKQEVASGIEDAGQELGKILDDMKDDIKVTVKIKSGTRMGILFLDPVIKDRSHQAVFNPGGIAQEVANTNVTTGQPAAQQQQQQHQ